MSYNKNSILKYLAIAIVFTTATAIGFVVFSLNTKNKTEELPTEKVVQPTPIETKKTTRSISSKRNIPMIRNNEQQNIFGDSSRSDDEQAEEITDKILFALRNMTAQEQQQCFENAKNMFQTNIDRLKNLPPEELPKFREQMMNLIKVIEKIDDPLNRKMTNEEKKSYRPVKELEEELYLLLLD